MLMASCGSQEPRHTQAASEPLSVSTFTSCVFALSDSLVCCSDENTCVTTFRRRVAVNPTQCVRQFPEHVSQLALARRLWWIQIIFGEREDSSQPCTHVTKRARRNTCFRLAVIGSVCRWSVLPCFHKASSQFSYRRCQKVARM